jgi:TonB-dependent receptor
LNYKIKDRAPDKIRKIIMKNLFLNTMVEVRSKHLPGLFMVLTIIFGMASMQSAVAQNVADSEDQIFTDSLSNAEVRNFGDYTIENAFTRFPGVHVNREGSISLRGTGYSNYYMLINGQRMSATGRNTRVANAGAVSVDLIEEIQWIKVLTPDMDADGLAGAIHLKTFSPLRDRTVMSGSLGGGVNPEYSKETGATGRSWLRYSGPVSDALSLSLGVNYQRDQQAWESLEMNYGTTDLGSGPIDVIERLSPGFQSQGVNRFSGNFQLDFYPTESSNYYLNSFVNLNQLKMADHKYSWIANGDWADADTTGGRQSDFGYDLNYEERNTAQYTFQAGGENIFDSFVLDYQVGWSQSDIERTNNLYPFLETGVEYAIDFSDPLRPTASPTEEKPIPADMDLEEMNYIIDDYRDKEISGRVNVEIPINVGSIKVGASALMKEQDANERGAYSEYHYQYQGFLDLEGFEEGNLNRVSIFDDMYDLDRLVDPEQANAFFQSSIPNMRLDDRSFYRDSEIYNYFSDENIYAGYAMANLDFDPITLIIGARVEHTASSYEGRVVEYNRFSQFEEVSDTSASNNLMNVFPNAQVNYQLNEQVSVKAAYSKTISRPQMDLLAPFELSTPRDTSLFVGNPNLDPIMSNNIDLMVDYIFNDGGSFSVSGFYKSMSGFIESVDSEIQFNEGEYPYFEPLYQDGQTQITGTQTTYLNSDNSANVYGVEVALQKQFTFLPGLLQNFGTYANYTWSDSKFENSRGDETAIPGQSPHVVNAALNYHKDRFFAQVSFQWSDEMLSSLESETQLAPAVGSGQVYLDRYQDGFQELSATAKYQVSDKVELWTNIYNLLNKERIEYAYSRDNYPTSIYKRNGIEFNVGVRISL